MRRGEDDAFGGHPRSIGVTAAMGAVVAVLTAPAAAAVVASAYRFPIPFGEYARGIGEATNAAFASVFYVVLGGGLILAGCGAIAGVLIARGKRRPVLTLTAAAGFGIALVGALVLSTLEQFIGAW